MNPSRALLDSELHRELQRIYAKTLVLRFAAGAVSFLAVAACVFLLVVVWAATTDPAVLWQTLAVSRTTLVLLAVLFVYLVIVPLVRMPRFKQLAVQMEQRKDFKDIVAAGYEFSERSDVDSQYSPELVREVIRQAVQSIRGLQVRFLFLQREQLYLVPVAYLALVILCVVAIASPGTLVDAGGRLFTPRSASALAHDANLYAKPGDITVLAGSDVDVRALDFGGSDAAVSVSYNLSEDFWKTESTTPRETVVDGATMDEFVYTFHDIRNSLTYFFQSGDRKSPEYHITVVHKPIVGDLQVVLTPPPYTGEAPDTLTDSGGNVQALEGTQVSVTASSNNTLANAWVRFDEKDPKPVDVSGNRFSFTFPALKDGTYSILLEDDLHHRTEEPLVYSVEVYQDNPPVVDVLEPGEDAVLPRNLRLNVGFVASDDYGVSRARIFFRKNGDDTYTGNTIPLGDDAGRRDVATSFTWDLSHITLFPGNYVEYFIQVEDNNVVTGPGVTKSRIYQVSVPTMAQLYEKVDEEESKRTDLLKEAREDSEALKERIEKLAREFKKSEQLDWTQKKEVDKAVASQQAVQEKLQEVQKSLEETLQSLSDNEMTTQEIGEKMEAIQKLIDEINDERLEKFMKDLRQAMEKLNKDDIEKALENLNLSSEDLLKSLERTENLLKEIQREQDMEELVRDAEDLMEAQDALGEKTADASETDEAEMNKLAGEQKSLAEQSSQLEKDLQDMAESLSQEQMDALEELAKQMEETAQEFAESDTPEEMQKAAQNLMQQDKQSAQSQQQQAKNNLVALFSKMAAMQMQMQSASQNQTGDNLQRLAKSTLELSFKQEKLTDRLREEVASDDPRNVHTLALQQLAYTSAIQQVADELYEISKHSLAVPKALLDLIGETIQSMQSAMMFLEENKAFMSTASASQAITSLNKATIELLSAAKNCQSGGGSGTAQQKLEQLMQGQRQMMKESQAMLQMKAMQEKLLQQRQAALQRLAAQQRSLQDAAKEIQKQVEQEPGERALGRMDKMIEEMEEVIRDLEGGRLDDQTMRNEERILSRLLDANRSVNTRDYEKKRLSTTADDIYSRFDQEAQPKSTAQELREEIRRALSLKAPGEFEDLIRLYFRALAEEAPLNHGEK